MSKIHFLIDQTKNDQSRQGWKDLVQRILNDQFNSSIYSQLINEYKIDENERVYKIHRRPFFHLPSRDAIQSKFIIQVGSIIRYSIIKHDSARMILIPSTILTQKRVTIMTSPKRCSSIDEQLTKIRRKSSRLSLRSISYGFDFETKPRKTISDGIISPSINYQLPSNKIELDLNQQEIIRRMGSFKKSL